jgi:hypothetical protein
MFGIRKLISSFNRPDNSFVRGSIDADFEKLFSAFCTNRHLSQMKGTATKMVDQYQIKWQLDDSHELVQKLRQILRTFQTCE